MIVLIDIIEVFKTLNYAISKDLLPQTLHFFSKDRAYIRNMIDKLSWDENNKDQIEAINYLTHNLLPCEYIYLVLPDKYNVSESEIDTKCYKLGTGKARWENAAKTIIQIGWPKVDHIIVPLFMWLLDPNWPGSQLIYDFILSLPKEVLIQKINEVKNNPQNYHIHDYKDLTDLLDEIVEEKQLSSRSKDTGDGVVCDCEDSTLL